MKIRAYGDHVVLEPMEAPKQIGGVLLPESSREEVMARNVGFVVSVGPLVNRKPADTAMVDGEEVDDEYRINEGDVVAYWPNQSRVAYIPGQDMLVRRAVRRADIIGKVESDPIASPERRKMVESREQAMEREAAALQNEIVTARMAPKMVRP